jgi:hypothetical protein
MQRHQETRGRRQRPAHGYTYRTGAGHTRARFGYAHVRRSELFVLGPWDHARQTAKAGKQRGRQKLRVAKYDAPGITRGPLHGLTDRERAALAAPHDRCGGDCILFKCRDQIWHIGVR